MRSGSVKDDDVEEPLPDPAKQYEPLLTHANELATLLRDGRLDEFYEKHLDQSLTKQMSVSDLQRMYDQVVSSAGQPLSFKPMQWYFRVQKSLPRSFVMTQKIVKHEKGTVYYRFTFSDEHATKIIGLHFGPRPAKGPYPI
jgi:hypothetical protein